jgi:hypothetical protein
MTRSGEKCRLERITSAKILKNAIQGLATKCVDGISAKEHRCRFYANATISVAAALNPYIGYTAAAEIAKESVRTRRPMAEIVLDRKLTWVLHDDSRGPCDGHTLYHRDLGLVAPASRRQFFVLLPQCRTAGGTPALPNPNHGKAFVRNPNSDCE